ncbi:hypothetical protein AAMO2058_001162500 [Amorphochlora amoebiformis]
MASVDRRTPTSWKAGLLVLVGLPATGKTSLARYIKKKFAGGGDGCRGGMGPEGKAFQQIKVHHICFDNIYTQLLQPSTPPQSTPPQSTPPQSSPPQSTPPQSSPLQSTPSQSTPRSQKTEKIDTKEVHRAPERGGGEGNTLASGSLGETYEFDPNVWKESRERAIEKVGSILKQLRKENQNKISEGPWGLVLIIVDDNMYYRSMRANIVKLARSTGSGVGFLYLSADIKSCIKRNNTRHGRDRVRDETMIKMAKILQPPLPERIPWERNTRTVDIRNFPEKTMWGKAVDWEWISSIWKHVSHTHSQTQISDTIPKLWQSPSLSHTLSLISGILCTLSDLSHSLGSLALSQNI